MQNAEHYSRIIKWVLLSQYKETKGNVAKLYLEDNMRTVNINEIIEAVERLCQESNYNLNDDIKNGLKKGVQTEMSENGKEILEQIIENAEIARKERMAICQDTGMAVVFLEIGQDVHITGGSLTDAINEGVRRGYDKGYLRKSVVNDPVFERINTKDNTPAVIHYNIVDGDKIKTPFL